MNFENKTKFWADIDFSGCYPTALALVPRIDNEGEVRECKAKLVIDADVEHGLHHEGLHPGLIRKLKRRLRRSEESFQKKLFGMKNRRLARRIRELCERPDNTLIEQWADRAREVADDSPLIPGFAKVRFRFREDVHFPCLPVPHEKYGLIYPLEGETCVTAAEVVLALEAGAEIEGSGRSSCR